MNAFVRELKLRFWAYACVVLLGGAAAFTSALFLDEKRSLDAHVRDESSQIAWMVFLADHADRPAVEQTLRSSPGVSSLRVISKEEAYDAVQKDPDLSKSLTLTGRNPFPESIEVLWDPAHLQADALARAAEKVRGLDGVESVGYDAARVARLNVLQRFQAQLELLIVALLWAGAVGSVVLLGRAVFVPGGGLPGPRLALCGAAGLLGGAAGVAAAHRLLVGKDVASALAGLAAGLFLALFQSAFRDI